MAWSPGASPRRRDTGTGGWAHPHGQRVRAQAVPPRELVEHKPRARPRPWPLTLEGYTRARSPAQLRQQLVGRLPRQVVLPGPRGGPLARPRRRRRRARPLRPRAPGYPPCGLRAPGGQARDPDPTALLGHAAALWGLHVAAARGGAAAPRPSRRGPPDCQAAPREAARRTARAQSSSLTRSAGAAPAACRPRPPPAPARRASARGRPAPPARPAHQFGGAARPGRRVSARGRWAPLARDRAPHSAARACRRPATAGAWRPARRRSAPGGAAGTGLRRVLGAGASARSCSSGHRGAQQLRRAEPGQERPLLQGPCPDGLRLACHTFDPSTRLHVALSCTREPRCV